MTGKNLAINLSKAEIHKFGLQEVISPGAKNGGSFPGMTKAESIGKLHREEDEKSQFNLPQRMPNEEEKKVMLAQVIGR